MQAHVVDRKVEALPGGALEPRMTADEAYRTAAVAVAVNADFSQHRKCSHWRS